jgi:ATP-dependent DNA helicase RecQ
MKAKLETSEAAEQFKRQERAKLDGLLGWCEITSCRRQALLGYFGETDHPPCGNCDTCLTPPRTWDASEAAQKLLSCIYRTGQRFGVGHIVDVLLGRANAKVTQFGHEQLSTFGIGKGLTEQQWRSLVRQLLIRGLLEADVEGYGALRLTERCRPVLRGEERLALREDTVEASTRNARARAGRIEIPLELQSLWQALRECRKRLAEERAIPPYMIFADKSLQQMALEQPQTAAELLAIDGVGQSKLANYGDAFLAVIREQAEEIYYGEPEAK